jgi:hypothetical protein
MADYADDWVSATENDDPPPDWSEWSNEVSGTSFRVNAAKHVEAAGNGDVRNRLCTLDAIDVDADRLEIDVLATFKVKGTGRVGLCVRAGEQGVGDDRPSGFYAAVNTVDQQIEVGGFSNSSDLSDVTPTGDTVADESEWAVRLRASGTTLTATLWEPGDIEDPEADEPGSVSLTWPESAGAGSTDGVQSAGLFIRNEAHSNVVAEFYRFAAATDGGVATFGGGEEALTAPTSLSATDDEAEQITLNWTNTRADLPTRIYRRRIS